MAFNKKDYQGEFDLDSTKTAVFADCVKCSVPLIEKIRDFTNNLKIDGLEKVSEELRGNCDCRYCSRCYKYKERDIRISVMFSNIGFTPDYRILLQVFENKGKSITLTDGFICAESQFYPPVNERWIAVTLDNYLLIDSTGQDFSKEVERKLNNLKL